jgi:hypothetical protein
MKFIYSVNLNQIIYKVGNKIFWTFYKNTYVGYPDFLSSCLRFRYNILIFIFNPRQALYPFKIYLACSEKQDGLPRCCTQLPVIIRRLAGPTRGSNPSVWNTETISDKIDFCRTRSRVILMELRKVCTLIAALTVEVHWSQLCSADIYTACSGTLTHSLFIHTLKISVVDTSTCL